MRITFLFAVFVFLTYSCSGDRKNFKIEVRVDGSAGKMMHLEKRTLSGTFPIDSALPGKSGTYILEGHVDQPEFYVIYTEPRHFINLIVHPGDDFRVLTDASSFDRNYLVEGSADSRLIQKLVAMQARTMEQITAISERYEAGAGQEGFEELKKEINKTYDSIFNTHKKFSVELMEQNPKSLATLMALYQQLGRNVPVFDYKNDFGYYEMVDSNLFRNYPNSEAVIDLNRKIVELREILRLEIGAQAPDISLPDSTGRNISLSALRGKKVLVFFWASWSSNSTDELDRYHDMYPKLKAMNLEFYQISLDRTRKSWLRKVAEASQGIHVSDLKYWDSPIADLYHIEKLPVVYLLDEKGVIVAKGFTAEQLPGILKQ